MTAVIEKNVTLYGADGFPLRAKQDTPEFDPTFLKSWIDIVQGMSSAQNIAQNPYGKHSWVYACASSIARPVSPLTPVLYIKDKPKDLIYDHPVLSLIEQPNPYMTGQEFFEAILLNLLLPTPTTPGGQCFVLPTNEDGMPIDLVRGDMPVMLWPYSDTLVSAWEDNGVHRGWEYKHPNGTSIYFESTQVIRIKLLNPKNWLLGQSPYSALEEAVLSDAKSIELSNKFKDNDANISKIITSPDRIRNEQLNEIKKQIQDEYGGYQNAGKILLLHSGFKFDQLSKSLTDLQHMDERKFTLDQIIAAYGTSKFELGLTETVNRATAQVEKERFWQNTLMFYIIKIWDGGFNPQWIRYVDKRNLKGKFDLSNVSALRGDVEGKIKNAEKLTNMGVPPNAAFQAVHLDVDTEGMEWLDLPLVRGPRTDLSSGDTIGQKPQAQPIPQEEPKEPEPKKPDKQPQPQKNIIKITQDERVKFWWAYIKRTQEQPEITYIKAIKKYWEKQRNSFLDKVDAWVEANSKSFQKMVALSQFYPDKESEDVSLIEMSIPIYIVGIQLQTMQLTDELGDLVNWDPTGPMADKIIKSRTKYLKGVNSTTYKTMGKEIEKILLANKGEPVKELAKLIKEAERKKFEAIIASHPKTVARTETSAIATKTRNDVMEAEGIKKHEWVAAIDESTRDTHASENGNIVDIGTPFPVTGLKHPLAEGPAEETVNCRCTTVAVK